MPSGLWQHVLSLRPQPPEEGLSDSLLQAWACLTPPPLPLALTSGGAGDISPAAPPPLPAPTPGGGG